MSISLVLTLCLALGYPVSRLLNAEAGNTKPQQLRHAKICALLVGARYRAFRPCAGERRHRILSSTLLRDAAASIPDLAVRQDSPLLKAVQMLHHKAC